MANLNETIAAIFKGEPSARQVEKTLADARKEADRLATMRDETRAKSLDPVATDAEVKASRAALADIDFEAERLSVAVDRLSEALSQAQDRERAQEASQAYERAKAERDALAKELAKVYPETAAKISELLARIVANNHTLATVNRDLPAGSVYLNSVEHEVRGVTPGGAIEGSLSPVGELVKKVRLPHLDGTKAMHDPAGYWGQGDFGDGIGRGQAAPEVLPFKAAS